MEVHFFYFKQQEKNFHEGLQWNKKRQALTVYEIFLSQFEYIKLFSC